MFYNSEKIKIGLLFLILIIYFYLNIYQLSFQHWSSMMDHDFYILYNSLLVSSGLEQEGRDHPAYITFLIHSLIFNFVDFFQNSYTSNLDQILSSSKIDLSLQFYFNISRITNCLINLFLLFSFYQLLKKIKIKREIISFALLIFVFSNWYTLSFYALRSENLSFLFINLSLIFILKRKNFIFNYFVAGIFFGIAMFTKIQILFFLTYILFFILLENNNNKKIKEKFSYNKITKIFFIFSLITIIFLYVIFQLKIQEYPRFEKNKYLDLYLFILSFVILFAFTSYYLRSNLRIIENKFVFFSIFFNGFIFLIFVLIVLDFFKILQINDFIYLRITNPLHYMSEFQSSFAGGSIDLSYVLHMIYKIFSSYSQNLIELFIIFSILVFTFKKYLILKNFNFFSLFFLFLVFLFITSINSLRSGPQYHIYYTFCYLIFLVFALNNVNFKTPKLILTTILIVFMFNNSLINKQDDLPNRLVNIFERKNSMNDICKEFRYGIKSKGDATLEYIRYWHLKFNDKVIKSLCFELKG